MKKKGYNGHSGLWREKPSKKLGGKRQKILCGALPSRRERGKFEKLLKRMLWTSQDLTFKKAHLRFSIDRNKQKLTNNFKRIFDWSKNKLDQSKIWKNRILKKTTWFLKTLLKALNIRSKIHEYKMKCFSKTQVLNPVFPNLRFSNILPLKSQTQNMFCTKKILKVISNLVGQTERHTQ